MGLLRSDFGQGQRASKTLGRGAVMAQPPLQLTGHRVKQVMCFQPLSAGNRGERIEAGLRSLHIGHRDRAIQRDDGRGFDAIEFVVVAQNTGPVRRCVVRRGAVASGNTGLKMIFADLGALRRVHQVAQSAFDERLVPLRAILIVQAQQIPVVIHSRRETRGGE